ncbi:MAG: 50S ribosomal protein L3 [Candidatus Pacebacteria bacterium]|nr:50S ribosomal protein L3 [Candidatus Paceibacterota bacterium]
MKFILAKKLKMSQVFDSEEKVIPVTILEAGPVKITQIKTEDKDGYEAIQIGYGHKRNQTKALSGHLKDLGKFSWLAEIRGKVSDYKIGDEVKVDIFKEGDKVIIIGKSKGKGFQGVVKRHGFRGSPASHGTKDRLRAPGSIGATGLHRVVKGKKMAGRMGNDQLTLKKIEVIKVDPEKGLLYLKGAIPGRRGSLIKVIG